MKSLLKNLSLTAIMAFSLFSCSKDSADPIGSDSANIQLSAPTGGSYELLASNANDNLFTMTWTSADYNFQAAVNYKLELVKSTSDFDSGNVGSYDLGNFSSFAGESFEKTVTVREFNTLVLAANGNIGTSESYNIRVVGSVVGQLDTSDNNLAKVYSQTVSINATAFDTFDEFERIYVPGGYQFASGYGNDWSPDSPKIAKLFSKANDGNYEGFVWMNVTSPEFKFTPGPSWNGDKGDLSENPNSFTTLDSPGKNIKPTEGAGTYFFTVNWNANTYTIAKRQVAIIGAATPNGWGTPTYLNFVTDETSPYYQMYTADLTLAADEFLIRLKDDWSQKMGTLSGNTENTTLDSQYKIKINGGNMKVPTAGNYKVVLDIRNSANYNLRLISN